MPFNKISKIYLQNISLKTYFSLYSIYISIIRLLFFSNHDFYVAKRFFYFHFFLCDVARKNMCDRHRPFGFGSGFRPRPKIQTRNPGFFWGLMSYITPDVSPKIFLNFGFGFGYKTFWVWVWVFGLGIKIFGFWVWV